jgi:acyl-CoA reductase-like NAD-dependent aldehyde dehydrogenase
VVINEVPSARVDSMPYGGIKESGFGREGIKYAMDEMSEIKVMLMKNMGKL